MSSPRKDIAAADDNRHFDAKLAQHREQRHRREAERRLRVLGARERVAGIAERDLVDTQIGSAIPHGARHVELHRSRSAHAVVLAALSRKKECAHLTHLL